VANKNEVKMQQKLSRIIATVLCLILVLGVAPQAWGQYIDSNQEALALSDDNSSVANDATDSGSKAGTSTGSPELDNGSDQGNNPGIDDLPDNSGADNPNNTDQVGSIEDPEAINQSDSDKKTTDVNTDQLKIEAVPSIQFRTHVQLKGWQQWSPSGSANGTTGESLRLEAVEIKLDNANGSVNYNAHVEGLGWQKNTSSPSTWFKDGATAGTSGQSKRVEAFQISLTGAIASQYDIYYRCHVQDLGWLAWAKNGAMAGTAGMAFKVEALQIQLVDKNNASDQAPNNSNNISEAATRNAYVDRNSISISTTAHVQDYGWLGAVALGQIAGTTGQSKRVEAIKINLNSGSLSSNISYSGHVQNIGWQSYVQNGGLAGTTGELKRIEAIKINLTGDITEFFDFYYRVHAQNYGWLGWARSDQIAGTIGKSFRLEAVQLMIVPKNGPAPGSTANPYPHSKIYLDAGHGPDGTGIGVYDPGAGGNGLWEYDLTKDLVTLTAQYARNIYGLDVYANTSGGDYRLRQSKAVNNGCTSFVSIHFNATGNGTGRGFESYIHSYNAPPRSAELQSIMHSSLVRAYSLSTTPNRGVKQAELAVCGGPLPATLLEIAFIDNASDMNNYMSRKDSIARELALGLFQAEQLGL
jgi:uncharacterized protein YjdB